LIAKSKQCLAAKCASGSTPACERIVRRVRCPPSDLSVAPEHGTVTVRRATLKTTNVKQCLAAELPALVAFYRPKPDSGNDDRFELEVSFAAGRKQIQRFHVTISNGQLFDLQLKRRAGANSVEMPRLKSLKV
jgi:hypothetical protein